MAKIAILGDTHFGARSSNKNVEHWQRLFYENVFWPRIKEEGIGTVIQTGDYFDNRKSIDLQTLAFQKEVFIDRAFALDVEVLGIIGNHDIPLRHSLAMSSPVQLLNNDNVHFTDRIKDFEFDGRTITLMPWICRDNFEQSQTRIREGGDILLGHFEIEGFVMHPGAISREGIHMSDFKGWNRVLSGHYHTQSVNKNIQYVGTPYQMTWNDATTKHGFWILDTNEDTMTFVENPYRYFYRLAWEDGCSQKIGLLEKAYVKINVKKKTDFEAFEKFVDRINHQQPFEVKIIESFEEFSQDNVTDLITIQSTEELIEEYISDVATSASKDSVTKAMLSIFEEAMSSDDDTTRAI